MQKHVCCLFVSFFCSLHIFFMAFEIQFGGWKCADNICDMTITGAVNYQREQRLTTRNDSWPHQMAAHSKLNHCGNISMLSRPIFPS